MLCFNVPFKLFPQMPLNNRIGICRSVAACLSRLYNLNYDDLVVDAYVAILDEKELLEHTPSLAKPDASPQKYWRAVRAYVERRRRPARKVVYGKRQMVNMFEQAIDDNTPGEDNSDAFELDQMRDVANSVLRHVNPQAYNIITGLFDEMIKSNTFKLTGRIASTVAAVNNVSPAVVIGTFNDFIERCRTEWQR